MKYKKKSSISRLAEEKIGFKDFIHYYWLFSEMKLGETRFSNTLGCELRSISYRGRIFPKIPFRQRVKNKNPYSKRLSDIATSLGDK